MIGLLTALPRTPLHARCSRKAGSCRRRRRRQHPRRTNIVPKHMSAERWWRPIKPSTPVARRPGDRTPHPQQGALSPRPPVPEWLCDRDRLRIVARLLIKGILPGGVARLGRFLRTLPVFSPARLPLVISDWIIGLSMREFAGVIWPVPDRRGRGWSAAWPRSAPPSPALWRRVTSPWPARGAVPNLVLSFRGLVDGRLFRRVTPD